jgi:hypothetical protein
MKLKGKLFSEELGIDLHNPKGRFQWFLASFLYGKRISTEIAAKTYAQFKKEKVLSPTAILRKGWDGLVGILDAGGYTRYDFSTADRLLAIARMLEEKYGGSVDEIHKSAKDSKDLEKRLKEFPGIGDVTVNIFLRELRTIWPKADPAPSKLALRIARKLKIKLPENRKSSKFVKMEAALVRLALEQKRRRK